MADDVDLRAYVDAMFAEKEKALQAALIAQEKAVAAALEAADKAVTKAEANAEKWRENANEWRGAMNDRDRALPSRRELEGAISGQNDKHAATSRRLTILETYMVGEQGRRGGIGASTGVIIGAIGIVGAVITTVVLVANFVTG